MTLDALVTGIWCGQIGGGVGSFSMFDLYGYVLLNEGMGLISRIFRVVGLNGPQLHAARDEGMDNVCKRAARKRIVRRKK